MVYHNSKNSRPNVTNNYGVNQFSGSTNDSHTYQHNQRSNGGHRSSLTDEERRFVDQGRVELFDKMKLFPTVTSLQDKSLLLLQNLFKANRWDIEELIQLKQKLNDTRNRLNEKDIKEWKKHTSKTNMTGDVVWSLRNVNDIEMCTNAWIKMAEIFSKYKNLIPKGKYSLKVQTEISQNSNINI